MVYSDGKIAGVFFFIAASQFILGLIVAEALYPGYSISANYISDLGVGPSSVVFNMSIFLVGLLTIIGTYFLQRAFNFKVITILITIAALAAMGVGTNTHAYFFCCISFQRFVSYILLQVNEISIQHYCHFSRIDEFVRVNFLHWKSLLRIGWVRVEWNVSLCIQFLFG
jgi:hypothetical membrane protein